MKKMKNLFLLFLCIPAWIAASSHRLEYKYDDIDKECVDRAGTRIDLQGVCMQDAIGRMKQKIIKSGKMTKAQLHRYLKPYQKRCTKKITKEMVDTEMIDSRDFDAYGKSYVYDCLVDDVYTLYRKLGFK